MTAKFRIPLALFLFALVPLDASAEATIGAEGLKATTSSVTVGSIRSDKAGYLVVHEVKEGKPGPVIGHAPIKAGENSGVTVSLEKKGQAGTQLMLMLHEESTNDTKFSMKDKPMMSGGKMIERTVTVEQ